FAAGLFRCLLAGIGRRGCRSFRGWCLWGKTDRLWFGRLCFSRGPGPRTGRRCCCSYDGGGRNPDMDHLVDPEYFRVDDRTNRTGWQGGPLVAAVARAHPNIALVKYWGKADDELIIPAAGSMSMTLDKFATTTSVALTSGSDTFELNGTTADAKATARTTAFLDL